MARQSQTPPRSGLGIGNPQGCGWENCLIIFKMQQERLLQILKQKNAELTNKFGVKSLLLFGSVARNEAVSTSDVDLLVEFNRPVGYFGLFALQDYLEELLGCPVDLGTPDSLKPYIKERVMGELIRVA